MMTDGFHSLRVRTGYSFRIAAGQLDEVASRLVEVGASTAPITDRNSAFGWVRWAAACKAHGLRPVFGVEIGVAPEMGQVKPRCDHWVFLARESVVPVNHLLQTATGQFFHEPRLSYKQALASADVFAVCGHRADFALVRENMQHPESFAVGLSPASAPGFIRRAREHGFGNRFAATGINLHPRADDLAFQQVLCSMSPAMRTYPTHLLDAAEWREAMAGKGLTPTELDAALDLSRAVLEACRAELPQAEMVRPERNTTLREMCETGAAKVGCDLTRPEYAERLDHELAVIAKLGFEDYFYVMSDLMTFARSVMTCGPGRGSSAGSLACYLLGITYVDPLPHGLLFERFLNEHRPDLPDVDSDFHHEKRDLLFDYAARRYGAERVARLGTVAMFGAKAAAEETGKSLGMPPWAFRPVKDAVEKHAAGAEEGKHALGDALRDTSYGQAMLREYPEAQIAARVESHPRHMGVHAAGLIVTQRPVREYVAIDGRTGVTHCDKKDAEKLGLLKIDTLGLTQLGVIEDCLTALDLPHDHMDALTFDDPKVFQVFNDRRFAGISQFNGRALQGLARQVRFSSFEDIVALTSLARPGPMASGGAATWIARNSGKEAVRYPHPLFEPHLRNTLGVIVYQEQVMSIAREIGGMDWADVNALRKAMGKSLGRNAFDKYGTKWKAGALSKGIPTATVDRVWDELIENGSYSFNKSHSVAYSMVSYWCAWLKAYHPLQFAAATLQHQKDSDKQIATLREFAAMGVGYVPVDAALSTDRWRVGTVNGESKLIGPVQNVEGIGPKIVASIVGARARKEPLPERAAKLLANPKTKLDSLYPIRDAFSRLLPDPAACNILTPRTTVEEMLEGEGKATVVAFVLLEKIERKDENAPDKVERRGHKLPDKQTLSVNMPMCDDTGTIFAKISRRDYERIGKPLLARAKAGKTLCAVKGTVSGGSDFRMVWVDQVKIIGEI